MKAQNVLNPDTDKRKWILLPAIARMRYSNLLGAQSELVKLSESSKFNRLVEGSGSKGVIAFGIAFNYVMEVKQTQNLDIPVLKVSQYPLPEKQIKEFIDKYDEILIAEEGYPVYEEFLRGFSDNKKLRGRLDGTLPRMGELSPDAMAKALGVPGIQPKAVPSVVVSRPPELCKGCSHRDLFDELNSVLNGYEQKHVFGDIGCYTLGALKPYEAINTCVDMGASVTMAKGAADAGLHPALAVIGDSTFTHSGITGLLDCVNDKSAVTIIISDNSTTAMTGGQDSAGTNKLFDICKGIGVDEKHIRTLIPLKSNLEENIAVLKEEFEYQGVSVILATRECVQVAARNKKAKK
ncbi:MAG: thiamine pyrophosphate-dependent enzyme, partial [Bacteroidota bacterium]|nr:thiamine pyrophosphate-dependent enzyme [Bacteroidota bacterium]